MGEVNSIQLTTEQINNLKILLSRVSHVSTLEAFAMHEILKQLDINPTTDAQEV
jgi:hypothetical protein